MPLMTNSRVFTLLTLVLTGTASHASAWQAGDPPSGSSPTAEENTLRVDSDFPGGSAEVLSLDQEHRIVRLRPTPHPGRGWECWWYFKLSGIRPGETITVDVGDAPWATPDRATFSLDNKDWRHTQPGRRDGKRVVYRQKIDGPAAWFAWGPPFVPADAKKLLDRAAQQCEHAKVFELCRTREDRPVPALRIDAPHQDGQPRYGLWIQARQHAWESGSSWVCRGLVQWITSDDPRAAALREQATITIIPIMDIDSVAIGAGGKNQTPHDHNRDWSDNPHWKAVSAAIKQITEQNEAGEFDLFIDLHNPGAGSRNPFFFISPRELLTEQGGRNLDRFLAAAREEMTGPLAFVGQTRESGAGYDRMWRNISKNWVTFNTAEHVVAVTLETAWNTPNSTTEGYRTVGRQLGMAVQRYLRTKPRE
jgi:hypothetical protein